MSYHDPEPDKALESLIFLFVALLIALSLGRPARGDVISEFGGGIKLPNTAYVMRPECNTVYSYIPGDRPVDGFVRSCGGDNPAFVGWPIAYEWTSPNRVWRLRGGWFHYSNWFDGGRRRETHMDCACGTATVNWSELRRSRRK